MFLRILVIACVLAVCATQVPGLIERPAQPDPNERNRSVTPKLEPVKSINVNPGRGMVLLAADQTGHFSADFRLNGRAVEGLVDTGASLVAINESTARRLGYGVNSLDFRHAAMTANGRTEAARITLDRVEIGNVRVSDVEAMVLRDKALTGTLVGMSFLRKLKSFQIEDGRLKLVQ